MLGARLAQHEVKLLEVDPTELGVDAAAGALGNPGGDFRASPEAAVGCRSSDGLFKLVLLRWGKIGRPTTGIDAVLINDSIWPTLVVAFEEATNPITMKADEFGHLADRLAGAEEPQGVPTASDRSRHLYGLNYLAVSTVRVCGCELRRPVNGTNGWSWLAGQRYLVMEGVAGRL